MSWFRVDDKFHSHEKPAIAGYAAIGAWTLAGSWCSDHLTDGRIPAAVAHRFAPAKVWTKLVEARLAETVDGAYQLHDFLDFNPSACDVNAERAERAKAKQVAGRVGGLRSGEARRAKRKQTDDVANTNEAEAEPKQTRSRVEAEGKQNEAPSRPDPVPIPDGELLPREVSLDARGERVAVDAEPLLAMLNRLAACGNAWCMKTRDDLGAGTLNQGQRAMIRKIDREHREKGLTPATVAYGDAYAAGMRAATSAAFAPPRAPVDIAAFRTVLPTFALDGDGVPLTGDPLMAWISASAAEYRGSIPPGQVQYQAGFSPEKWRVWLNSGKPTAGQVDGSRRPSGPQRHIATQEEQTWGEADVGDYMARLKARKTEAA